MCSRPAIDAASVRIELKPRLPWYGIFALLLFALFMLSFAAWLFFCVESVASALWVSWVALIMGVAMVGTLLYLPCGRKYLLMSREETLYILLFLGYSWPAHSALASCMLKCAVVSGRSPARPQR